MQKTGKCVSLTPQIQKVFCVLSNLSPHLKPNHSSSDFAKFQNSGYMGLYGGETASDIKRRKKLKPNQEILDHMGSVELGANLFRITQAEDKLRRENISSKEAANKVHYEVGRTVRKTIEELGGTMPEKLPTPSESIKQLDKPKK